MSDEVKLAAASIARAITAALDVAESVEDLECKRSLVDSSEKAVKGLATISAVFTRLSRMSDINRSMHSANLQSINERNESVLSMRSALVAVRNYMHALAQTRGADQGAAVMAEICQQALYPDQPPEFTLAQTIASLGKTRQLEWVTELERWGKTFSEASSDKTGEELKRRLSELEYTFNLFLNTKLLGWYATEMISMRLLQDCRDYLEDQEFQDSPRQQRKSQLWAQINDLLDSAMPCPTPGVPPV